MGYVGMSRDMASYIFISVTIIIAIFPTSGSLQSLVLLLSYSMIILASPMTNLRHGYIVLLSYSMIMLALHNT